MGGRGDSRNDGGAGEAPPPLDSSASSGHVTSRPMSPQYLRFPMLTFATKQLSTGANGQMEDAASVFVSAVLIELSWLKKESFTRLPYSILEVRSSVKKPSWRAGRRTASWRRQRPTQVDPSLVDVSGPYPTWAPVQEKLTTTLETDDRGEDSPRYVLLSGACPRFRGGAPSPCLYRGRFRNNNKFYIEIVNWRKRGPLDSASNRRCLP